MLIAKIKNNKIVDLSDYRAMFPDTSFGTNGPNEDFLSENGCMKVTVFKPHNRDTEKLVSVTPYIENNQVFTINVEPLTNEELQERLNLKCEQMREIRNKLLLESDWTQLADSPVDKNKWAIYRQQLRDITNQPDFPNIDFPEKP